ncbi:methionine--tRNA ligase [Candidatus Woesebacteria bacterium CG22_combo_CG10-13_8_21_14_all_39_10]|uniref:Methionine--tRNA ligase n=2 Tax=Candidatus Woeseibacteriota TaxID=1752722 RepID=A0A2H0BKB3_9BACT|nr:MAG: methionine--tRNA ligase [Candidatus Woesebacteria bacterium CG22_combo_CG10-13_8_21_14_all_39_10]PIZ49566.1 MAG: methionine--tRNA ligase [Candidatus Woesebacteria bacterium CG_4_10_14_0_2_um_filter_39_14]
MDKKFYVTTAIDYTNDVIHIGHSYQKIIADVLARYHRLMGDKTFFLTGTDEHGGTSEQAAKKAGKIPKEFVDEISKKDKEQLDLLNISYDRFIRTTDPDHKKTVEEFYKKVEANGDIYKGEYKGFYCTGCESYKNPSEIVDGKCSLHPTRELEEINEENYFFKWSKYADFLKKHILDNPDFIKPESQRKNMLGFLEQGLEDIAISRPIEKVSWGIPVPGDPKQTIYVWFDAIINYVSGAPDFWPADVHILGKDNVRWHALLWPAMLKSAGYELPKTIYGHGFINLNGEKISKSRGNVIRPNELVEKFGVDAVRYYFIKYGPLIEDVDISLDKIKEVYNSDLANGLGNLISRIAKLCENSGFEFENKKINKLDDNVAKSLDEFRFDEALKIIWEKITTTDQYINTNEPWKLKGEELKKILTYSVNSLATIAYCLLPFLPETAQKIEKQFKGPKIKSGAPLFPRI